MQTKFKNFIQGYSKLDLKFRNFNCSKTYFFKLMEISIFGTINSTFKVNKNV